MSGTATYSSTTQEVRQSSLTKSSLVLMGNLPGLATNQARDHTESNPLPLCHETTQQSTA